MAHCSSMYVPVDHGGWHTIKHGTVTWILHSTKHPTILQARNSVQVHISSHPLLAQTHVQWECINFQYPFGSSFDTAGRRSEMYCIWGLKHCSVQQFIAMHGNRRLYSTGKDGLSFALFFMPSPDMIQMSVFTPTLWGFSWSLYPLFRFSKHQTEILICGWLGRELKGNYMRYTNARNGRRRRNGISWS